MLLDRYRSRAIAELAAIRDAIAARYVVGGACDVIVRREEVHRSVAEARGWRIIAPHAMRLVNEAAEEMGAQPMRICNVALFAAVRRRDLPLRRARFESSGLRRSLQSRKHRDRVVRKYDVVRILTEEGMPEELPSLSGFGPCREVAVPRIPPAPRPLPLGVEAPGVPMRVDGVWRIPASAVGPAITQAALGRAGELARILEQERAVLLLMAEGLSIREIAARTGMDRNRVHRTIQRVRARLGAETDDERDETPDSEEP